MILDKHYWRTNDGRIVPDGDPDAAFLAYPKGHEVADSVAEKVGLKAAAKPENKMAGKPSDKAVREWAAKEGIDVPARGKLPADVVELYLSEQEK